MKKTIYIVSLALALFSSCKDSSDMLDPDVISGVTDKDLFADVQYAERYLYDIYDQLIPVLPIGPAAGSRWRTPDTFLEVASDNGHGEASWGIFKNMNVGDWSASTNSFSHTDWNMYWNSIRAINNFLVHIDEVPLNANYSFDEDRKAKRKAEAKLLLAWNYAELVKEFGGVPIIDKVYGITDDDMMLPRNTYDECVDFISRLCDEAAAVLPLEQTGSEFGRGTKGAALAVKARTLFYAASPLWNNPDKPQDSPFRGKYDPQKWVKAAKAYGEVIKMNQYSLIPDITKVFLTRVNPEFIFTRVNRTVSYLTGSMVPNKLYPSGGGYGNGGFNHVTYNLLKEYDILKDGKAYNIEDPTSGYDPQNPYIARDPRFYRDCLYNGCKILGKTADFGVSGDGVAAKGAHNDPYGGPEATYVYAVKFADTHLNITWNPARQYGSPSVDANYPYIRYAQVLMDYAEAMNEAYGPESDALGIGMTALDAVNQIRARAKYPTNLKAYPEYLPPADGTVGMPPLPSGLSKDDFRLKLRKERRVEFMYEEHRFWDIRRWKLPTSEVTDIYAQIPEWYMDNGVRKVRYVVKKTESRVMEPKMYRMPIPEDQLFANKNLVQNPGWPDSPEASE